IAQLGSWRAMSVNFASALSYAKECSSATPRSKDFCTVGAQEVGNETVPSFSGSCCCACDSSMSGWANVESAISKPAQRPGYFIPHPEIGGECTKQTKARQNSAVPSRSRLQRHCVAWSGRIVGHPETNTAPEVVPFL